MKINAEMYGTTLMVDLILNLGEIEEIKEQNVISELAKFNFTNYEYDQISFGIMYDPNDDEEEEIDLGDDDWA